MFNLRRIVENNASTFYDFDTQKRRSQRTRYLFVFLFSGAAALACPKVSENLLAGFLAVQSILLGFTVNVMFFLLGNREVEVVAVQSIEGQLRSERLRTLYHELFYNVSYFNLIAVVSIIVAAALLLPTPEIPRFLRGLQPIEIYASWLATSNVPEAFVTILHGAEMFAFYVISIEVVFTITRVIGRTSFYFEQKMRTSSTPPP